MLRSTAAVLVAALLAAGVSAVSLPKCCPEGERFSSDLKTCLGTGLDQIPGLSYRGPLLCSFGEALKISEEDTDRIQLLHNGSLELRSHTSNNSTVRTIFGPSEFCADLEENSTSRLFLVCPCNRVKCVFHCCGEGQVMRNANATYMECFNSPNGTEWKPPFYPKSREVAYEIIHNSFPLKYCKYGVWYTIPEYWKNYPRERYFHDWWRYPGGYGLQGRTVCGDLYKRKKKALEELVAYCFQSRYLREDDDHASAAVHGTSVVFLSLTLLAHAALRELRETVHGWCVACHAACLLVANSLLLNAAIERLTTTLKRDLCETQDYVCLFGILGANFWLNAMCINMFLGFRQHRSQTSKVKKFAYFSAYAWGCTAFMTALTVGLSFVEDLSKDFKPTLTATRTCWYDAYKEHQRTAIYFYGPMFLLLFANVFMFVFVAKNIRKLQRGTSILKRSESKQQEGMDSSRIILYVKIFLLMGVAEMAVEITTWITTNDFVYFVGMDVVDLLRAFSIFCLCCCNRRVLNSARQIFRNLPLRKNVQLTVSQRTSTTTLSN